MEIKFLGFELRLRRTPVIEETPVPTVKEKPQEKPKIQKCTYRDKRMFTREQAAAERDAIKDPRIRIYCCEFCQHWHLTHKKRNDW